ncbi:MAG: AarF/ABC1/UbiB kinase family protein [Anaerolineales bacterium]|nr:AarF/ABC1/UbiB kinase family protein [Anaerolineales bacterium]MCB0030040.1 AarF/ABC1/UbiB kinase family protein [Anaerolineales bacterium]MCB8963388.1 AarF/ABC1/UbiB kinase family protein [Ardenticatenales bacterium]
MRHSYPQSSRYNLRPRHLRRYRQITELLARHGFGAILAQMGLVQRLNLPRRLLRRQPIVERTPAEHVRLALEELGPTFVKFGQILGTRPDLIPPDYITELSQLQDNVPPVAWEEMKTRIEGELDAPLEEIFTSISPTPLAAASLSQVHAATLLNGEEVVVKVQRPSIERIIDLDLDILYDLARLAQERTRFGEIYNMVDIAEDFAATLRAEMDYRREGRNADRFRANFSGETRLYVPRIHWDYSTRRVLVLERIRGIKIDDIAALNAAGYDRRQVALNSAAIIIKEVLEDGFFHADPHPGNFMILPGEAIGAMDFGMVGHLDGSLRLDLMRLYIAAIQLDTAAIVRQLINMGVTDHRLDEDALQRDIRRLLLKYEGLPLKEIRAREVMEEITPVAFRHHLHLPNDLWLLGKTLAMMEGVGLKLDPDFDMFAVSEPFVRILRRRLWQPTTWGPDALRGAANWADLLANFPRQTSRLLQQLEQGQAKLQVDTPDLMPAANRLERIVNRLVVSILLAAFMVALALLIPILDLAWPWGLLTWLVMLGFGAMSVLGLWLLWSILRSGRP